MAVRAGKQQQAAKSKEQKACKPAWANSPSHSTPIHASTGQTKAQFRADLHTFACRILDHVLNLCFFHPHTFHAYRFYYYYYHNHGTPCYTRAQ